MPTLSARLKKIAEYVVLGERVADIGTDHAYLPIFLRANGISPFVIASDINPNPLKSAVKNAAKAGADGIDFRLCDGLCAVGRDETDTVIIAGMGGECIVGILSECTWAKNSGKHFILQPMNSPEELRRYLCQAEYTIESESAVVDGGHFYTVMNVYAERDQRETNSGFIYTGRLNPEKPADRAYLEKQRKRLFDCAVSLQKTGKSTEADSLFKAVRQIDDYIKQV